MFAGRPRTEFLVAIVASGLGVGATLGANGCTTEPWHATVYCLPDASPDADINGDCFPDGGDSLEPMSCKAAGGECVPMGTSDFRQSAVLLWMGVKDEAPDCPERANGIFYTGYAGLSVSVQCSGCACGPAACALPGTISVDSEGLCQGANKTSYDAPMAWDGACVSPSVIPSGSLASIALASATVSPCEPIGDPIPKPPGFAADAIDFGNGVYWQTFAKACQGTANGKCENTGDLCLPSAEPPPPGFRQCVQYTLPVDVDNLPQCPVTFPEQFVFYAGTEGTVECSPCVCGEPMDAQCIASISAFQDPACGNVPPPLFKDVPAGNGTCIDFAGMPFGLGAISAQWISNAPGTCDASGGEPVGDVKAIDPRVFCCR